MSYGSNGESRQGQSVGQAATENQSPGPAQPSQLEKAREAALAVVKVFRKGEVTKTSAIIQITSIISNVTLIEPDAIASALDTYFEMLDEISISKRSAARRADGNEGPPSEGDPDPPEEDEPEEDGETQGSFISRSRSRSPDHKRRKVDETAMPWLIDSFIKESTLSTELRKTLEYL